MRWGGVRAKRHAGKSTITEGFGREIAAANVNYCFLCMQTKVCLIIAFSGAYLYRKERKKHSRKLSERVTQSSEEGSCDSPAMDEDDSQRPSSSSDEDSSMDEETITIDLTQELRDCLDQDFYLIHTKNKVCCCNFRNLRRRIFFLLYSCTSCQPNQT